MGHVQVVSISCTVQSTFLYKYTVLIFADCTSKQQLHLVCLHSTGRACSENAGLRAAVGPAVREGAGGAASSSHQCLGGPAEGRATGDEESA